MLLTQLTHFLTVSLLIISLILPVSKCLCDIQFLAGVKPWQVCTEWFERNKYKMRSWYCKSLGKALGLGNLALTLTLERGHKDVRKPLGECRSLINNLTWECFRGTGRAAGAHSCISLLPRLWDSTSPTEAWKSAVIMKTLMQSKLPQY